MASSALITLVQSLLGQVQDNPLRYLDLRHLAVSLFCLFGARSLQRTPLFHSPLQGKLQTSLKVRGMKLSQSGQIGRSEAKYSVALKEAQ